MLSNHISRCFSSPLVTHLVLVQRHRAYSSRPSNDADDFGATRQWYKDLKDGKLDLHGKTSFSGSQIGNANVAKLAKISYTRASGPGGQKVNKTNSKAVTVWDMEALEKLIPKTLHPALLKSSYYARSSNTFKIECDTFRNQTDNRKESFRRLDKEIERIYEEVVPGATSKEQQLHVKQLVQADNHARLKMKKQHSDKKQARKKGGWD
ncbi:hypothetical protein BJ875DRAFT_159505 [Amylocarpus encephaloides]|uniref:Prokaryotic-type class I peptide chain release factors domain-containing protein n=1 Tax=Amylocarpus encephaloides TaxID=45428 RepID=A0A9P7YAT5_9HELO|nr:hypothetical protein BJ875DRAFT_159505 [Amylocarpus encephaloides]